MPLRRWLAVVLHGSLWLFVSAGQIFYSADALVRRAESLQQTADAAAPVASLPQALWAELGLSDGAQVKVSQDGGSAVLPAVLDASLPANVVRVPAGHAATSTLGAMFGAIRVEKA